MPVSAMEWTASANMAELLVIRATISLMAEIRALPISAARTTVFDPDAMAGKIHLTPTERPEISSPSLAVVNFE